MIVCSSQHAAGRREMRGTLLPILASVLATPAQRSQQRHYPRLQIELRTDFSGRVARGGRDGGGYPIKLIVRSVYLILIN